MTRRRRRTIGGLVIGLVGWMCTVGVNSTTPVFAAGSVTAVAAPATPNHFNPTSRARSAAAKPPPASKASGPRIDANRNRPPAHLAGPATVALDPAKPVHLASGDAALQLDVPAGAVTASDVKAAGGAMSLLVRQVAPASGGSGGGSGVVSFGTYLVQVLDAGGRVAAQGLRKPAGVQLSIGTRAAALGAGHAVAVVNAPLPAGVSLDPTAPVQSPAATRAGSRAVMGGSSRPAARLGPMAVRAATVDTQAGTLSTSAAASTGSTSFGFDSTAPVSTFGAPNLTEMNPGAGSLTLQQPIDLPAGPGGLTPPLGLGYDSAAVNDQHNVAGAAPWVGEGWHLTLGSISWVERNIDLGCGTVCESPQWNDTWQLVDAFGTQAELIPPSTGVSTYYEDNNLTSITPSPVAWHTAPEAHARVISYTGPNALPGMAAAPPCFRVFLPTGIMEEFGCTPDSLQFFPQSTSSGNLDFVANWLLDLITDPSGNQVHVTYQTDTESGTGGIAYPRDAVMATVEYDSPGCHSAQTACTGSAWAPLMRVSFQASHSVTHVSGRSCAASGSQRCDDPVDLSASGGLAAPAVESTFVLNDVLVQVRGSVSAAWNTVRDYRLAYDQGGPATITDPFSGVAQSTAGRLLLTSLTEIGGDGSTALPSRTFGYSQQTQLYEDSVWAPTPSTNCGPSWNNGATFGQGCNLWSQSYAGNSSYLSSASNGQGLTQTFSWQNARNNTDGVPSGQDLLNPFVCNTMQSTSPCDVTDDGSWSRIVLTQRADTVLRVSQSGQGGAQTSTPVTATTTLGYRMAAADSFWGDSFDWDVLDFYNWRFMGFGTTTVTNPDGSSYVHQYPGTQGRGVYSASDPMEAGQCANNACNVSPWWLPANVEHGREIELDQLNPDGSLQQVTRTQYQAVCPPAGVTGDKAGNLVSELDPLNPVAVCDVAPTQVDIYFVNGGSQSTAPHLSTTYALDSSGRVTAATETGNDGGGAGSPTTIALKTSYTTTDSVTATATTATGQYLVDFPSSADVEDGAGNRSRCSAVSYDSAGRVTTSTTYTNCGTSANGFAPSGPISTSHTYDASGNALGADTPDAVAGVAGHTGCTVGGTAFSSCATFDGAFDTLPTSSSNALNQRSTMAYQAPASGTATGGFGLWPISTTDANGQTTTLAYDALGRPTGSTLPGEGAGLATTGAAYTVWCSGTAAQAPCLEVDHTQRLNGTTTVTARAFYDGLGHLVETRTPAPGGQDVVSYSFYDQSERLAFRSNPYFVAAYTGAPGASAYSIPDTTQAGSTTTYDGMGRVTSATDALSHRSTSAYSMVCAPAGTGDSGCYRQVLAVDGNGHQAGSLTDALGRTDYEQRYTGSTGSASFALYTTLKYTFDAAGDLIKLLAPDGTTTTTVQFDAAGRRTATTDPDLGTQTYTYDQDGNLVQSVDARGAAGTTFLGYDGLDRPLWHNTTNSPTGAYYTYTYDSTAAGNPGIGRLTGETFTNGSLSGSYALTYDSRGRQTGMTMTVGGASYPAQTAYDDAGNVLSSTYPDGETVSNSYTAQGWLNGVSAQQGSTTTSILSNATYSGTGGAFGNVTSASTDGSTYTYASTQDLLDRTTQLQTRTSGGTTLFQQSLTFDAAGDVSSASTTMPTGTDNQAFCYDEQNRLTWAGSTGTAPCTGTAVPAGTLTAAQYTQSFGYDTLGRLTTGALGSYTYGDTAHTHAATAAGSSYTASYNAAGNMTCRAPSGASTCAGGSPTGAQLAYNNEGQLVSWQGGGVTDTFLYDCQGQRVAQQAAQGGTSTTTVYVGGTEAVTTSGSTTSTKTYYAANGHRVAMAVNGSFAYLASDGLGSTAVALSAGGAAIASQLSAPYGSVRYSSGSMPTDYSFTGQRADAASGLDYYGARYYDPVLGQFTSPDTVTPGGGADPLGLSRYAYSRGNPTSRTDPTGHDDFGGDFGGGFDFSSGFDSGFGGGGGDSGGGGASGSFDNFGAGATPIDTFSNLDFGGADLSQFGIASDGGTTPITDANNAFSPANQTAGIDTSTGTAPSPSDINAAFNGSGSNFGAGATPFNDFGNLDFNGANLTEFGIGILNGDTPNVLGTAEHPITSWADTVAPNLLAPGLAGPMPPNAINPGWITGPVNIIWGIGMIGTGLEVAGWGLALTGATAAIIGASPLLATAIVVAGLAWAAFGVYSIFAGGSQLVDAINNPTLPQTPGQFTDRAIGNFMPFGIRPSDIGLGRFFGM
jgi:RHS repeat-associated protein